MLYDNTYVNIDMDAILANFEAVRSKTGAPVMAIIKADAYGHGAVQIARLLEEKVAFLASPAWVRPWSCGSRGWRSPS